MVAKSKIVTPFFASTVIQKVPYTTFVLVHARSAFGEETIGDMENNQPFHENEFLFATNFNLQGVKIKSPGKIGAHKIFNLLKNKGIKIGLKEIHENTKYVKALNFIAIQNNQIIIHNAYGQDGDSEYFNLWEAKDKERIVISSEIIPNLEMKSLEGKGTFTYKLQ